MIRLLIVLAALLCLPVAAHALPPGKVYRGEVVRVIDGDTFELAVPDRRGRDGTRTITIRLYGIDAPEIRTPAGPAAKAALETAIGDKPLSCAVITTDIYRRIIAICRTGGDDVGALMIARGTALPEKSTPGYYGGN